MSFTLVAQELGHALDRAQLHSVSTLNEISPAMLEDLKRLSHLAIQAYLQWYLHPGSEAAYEEFMHDVVHGDMDPKVWGFADILVHVKESQRGRALMVAADKAREMLLEVEGERWNRVFLDSASLMNRSGSASALGEPGVLVRNAPYWWSPPRKEVDYLCVSSSSPSRAPAVHLELEAISEGNFFIAYRRWIARRVFWWTRSCSFELSTASPQQIVDAIGIDMSHVTADGAIALSAAIREASLPFDPGKQIRGFAGPDEWYAG